MTGAGEKLGGCVSGCRDSSGGGGTLGSRSHRQASSCPGEDVKCKEPRAEESTTATRRVGNPGGTGERQGPRGRARRTSLWSEQALLAATMKTPQGPSGFDNKLFFWKFLQSSVCEAVGPEGHTVGSGGVTGGTAAGDRRNAGGFLKKLSRQGGREQRKLGGVRLPRRQRRTGGGAGKIPSRVPS